MRPGLKILRSGSRPERLRPISTARIGLTRCEHIGREFPAGAGRHGFSLGADGRQLRCEDLADDPHAPQWGKGDGNRIRRGGRGIGRRIPVQSAGGELGADSPQIPDKTVFCVVPATSFVLSGLKASGIGTIGRKVVSRTSSRPVVASANSTWSAATPTAINCPSAVNTGA